MPIYEYVCETCGKEFEVMQKFSDKPVTKHDCSPKSRVHRKLSAPSFHLQGGGWYNEGYSAKKDGNGKPAPEAKAAEGSAGNGASETKGEAKGDTKGEAKAEKKEGKESKGAKKEKKAASAPAPA